MPNNYMTAFDLFPLLRPDFKPVSIEGGDSITYTDVPDDEAFDTCFIDNDNPQKPKRFAMYVYYFTRSISTKRREEFVKPTVPGHRPHRVTSVGIARQSIAYHNESAPNTFASVSVLPTGWTLMLRFLTAKHTTVWVGWERNQQIALPYYQHPIGGDYNFTPIRGSLTSSALNPLIVRSLPSYNHSTVEDFLRLADHHGIKEFIDNYEPDRHTLVAFMQLGSDLLRTQVYDVHPVQILRSLSNRLEHAETRKHLLYEFAYRFMEQFGKYLPSDHFLHEYYARMTQTTA